MLIFVIVVIPNMATCKHQQKVFLKTQRSPIIFSSPFLFTNQFPLEQGMMPSLIPNKTKITEAAVVVVVVVVVAVVAFVVIAAAAVVVYEGDVRHEEVLSLCSS